MDPAAALERLGGGAAWAPLVALTGRRELRRALADRRVDPQRREQVDLRWRDLRPDEVDGHVTSPIRTVLDCARDLPFAEALAVADSALRHGVDRAELIAAARALPSTGRKPALRVVLHASPFAANPFESVLRAIAADVVGLDLRPQEWLFEKGSRGRPDLVDLARRIVVEAESFEFHGRSCWSTGPTDMQPCPERSATRPEGAQLHVLWCRHPGHLDRSSSLGP